jgi:hypothetical protein
MNEEHEETVDITALEDEQLDDVVGGSSAVEKE